jgi:outer membrane protein assembly factor BamB
MTELNRRTVLGAGLAVAVIMTARADDKRVSTIKPFAKGDVFVGATFLNNPEDDHAGLGRIIQYDADLNEKGVLWVEGTTHLVGGLNFAPDGTLWAFDNLGWLSFQVDRNGKQTPPKDLVNRAIGKAIFLKNGNVLLTEYFKGHQQPQTLTTRYKELPDHPGEVGTGKLYEIDAQKKVVRTYTPDVHGGVSGSMAVTHATLGSDGKTLIYTSETGPRLMRFDLEAQKQLPDLKVLPASQGGPPAMFLDVARIGNKVLLPVGNKLMVLDEQTGADVASFPLPGFGWAVITPSYDGAFAYVGNWFTGDVAKVSLTDGALAAKTKIAPKCISGIAQFAE